MPDEVKSGVITELAEGIRRIVAPNPSLMTGPGTNTYLLGARDIAVIDPGPDIDAHVRAIISAGEGRIRWILATHTHPDHSPAVAPLAKATGAEVLGLPAPEGSRQDQTFAPDRQPGDAEMLSFDGIELQALHTPGHASNHLCFLLSERGWLFTGDHIIHGSTVVIDPPDGNMAAYVNALQRLRALSASVIAGGHGALIDTPQDAIDRLIAHRLGREAKVVDTLKRYDDLALSALVGEVYDDVDASLHRLAERSLLAHLLKLADEGRVLHADGRWSLCRH